MAFEVTHKGPPRKRFLFMIRRQSDGHYWTFSAGWSPDATYNIMAEQSPGHYGFWLTATKQGECYEVVVRPQMGPSLIKSYTCDSKGKPIEKPKGKPVNASIVQGTLYVGGKAETAEVVYEEMSSNGVTKYTAIKWGPSGITSCNCPGWTTNAKHKGKDITERSCKHTKKVAVMTTSNFIASSTLLPSASPMVGNTERSGRGIELD